MKIVLFCKKKVDGELEEKIKDCGFKYSEIKPDIVISLGGDGTYLRSERKWPGVPKIIVKYNSIFWYNTIIY